MAIRQVRDVLKGVAMGRSRFLYGLDRVPDDRLNWSPGGAARTPLQLAGKTASFLGRVATYLETRARAPFEGWPPPPATREEARTTLEAAFDRLQTVIAGLSESDLKQMVPLPWGEWTLAASLGTVNGAILYHQGQLNYLQMAYGDEDANIPPNWGQEEA